MSARSVGVPLKTEQIAGFNGVRAISVLLVMASHAGIIEAASGGWEVFFSVFNASFGVRTFFVLSGLLITTLLIEEFSREGRVSVLNFMARRALRIFPLYFIALFSLAPLALYGRSVQAFEAAAYGALFVYNFIPHSLNVHYLSHLWSLAVEEQFYLAWPLVFSAVVGSQKWVLPLILVTLIVCCFWVMRVETFAYLSDRYSPNRWTIPAIYPIAIGALAALSLKSEPGIIFCGVLRHWFGLVGGVTLITLPFAMRADVVAEFAGTFGIAIILSWISLNQRSVFVKILEWRPLHFIGTISYGVYIYQGLLTGNGSYRSIPWWPPEPLIGAILTFPVATFSYFTVERYFLRFKKSFPAGPSRTLISGASE